VKSIKPVGVEQSNTTVIAENKYVVKVLRKITPGAHPEIEIGRFFVEDAPFANAPRMLGSVELMEGAQRSAVAVVHEFIENQGDAWTFVSHSLDRLINEQQLLPAETISDTPESAAMLGRIRQIGLRTAQFHDAISSRPDLPDFAPAPIEADDIDQWVETQLKRADNVFMLLERSHASLPDAAKPLATELLDNRAEIVTHIKSNRGSRIEAMKIRHHGDFHLGQVLIVKDDAYLLDFEGEPRRSLEERRRKAPAARDIAGFCRSIDYATSAALERVGMPEDEKAKLVSRLRLWTQKLIEAYWGCYRDALQNQMLWPHDDDASRELLEFFMLEKAIYEIEYELTNRPAWVGIPLEATLRLLRQGGVLAS
jgi:maltose alpha-D-glucosyltransferase / alpha-amylase